MSRLEARSLPGRTVERLQLDEVVLAYGVAGTGEPVLLLHPGLVADGLAGPLCKQQELISSYQLITYHRRGCGDSTAGPTPLAIAAQAADAAALLSHLQVTAAHVVGHSIGGVIALQLAHDRPDLVHSVALLEPSLTGVPTGTALRERILAAQERYRSGDKEGALDVFLTDAFGADWRAAVEAAVPGAVSQAAANV
jgi:pimeloyl-ACP methyl ester carboxylesterase